VQSSAFNDNMVQNLISQIKIIKYGSCNSPLGNVTICVQVATKIYAECIDICTAFEFLSTFTS